MSQAIHISKTRTLPIDAVTQTIGCIARRGAGKTYTAGKIVEGMLEAGAPVVVLDPIGTWYGLRLAANGKSPGLPIPVLGGLHGDLPLSPQAGRAVAELVMRRAMSAVVDVSAFRKADRKRFVADFAERLFELAKAVRAPMHVVIEEAQVFAPQMAKGQERMLGAIEDIVRLGRNYGLGATLISQRPQSVNKEVLNQVECLFIGQLSGAHERKAIEAWVVENAEGRKVDTASLPSLPVGTMMLWSPQWLGTYEQVKIGKKKTFDASATPSFGKRVKARELAPIDMDELRTALADVEEEAKADDPRELRKRIAALEKQLRAAQVAPAPEAGPGLDELLAVKGAILELASTVDKLIGAAGKRPAGPLRAAKPAGPTASPPPRPKASAGPAMLPRAEQMILTALAQHGRLSLVQAALIAGYSAKSSGVRNAASALRTKGYVEGTNAAMATTNAGLDALGTWEPLPTGRALAEHWYGQIGKAEREILRHLVEAYPNEVSLADAAEAVGYSSSSSGVRNAASRLRTLMLIEGPNAAMRASGRLVHA
ncbi:MAG: ATP-binding protein [Candidatus Deferrimicrobiaceae bacterium]